MLSCKSSSECTIRPSISWRSRTSAPSTRTYQSIAAAASSTCRYGANVQLALFMMHLQKELGVTSATLRMCWGYRRMQRTRAEGERDLCQTGEKCVESDGPRNRNAALTGTAQNQIT